MIVIEPVTFENIAAFKAVRLRALKKDPYAFSATYQKESEFTDAEWQARVNRMDGTTSIGFLAMNGDIACGLVAAIPADEQPTGMRVVSMWTAPEHRRLGVGRLLIASVADWARGRNCRALFLMVTSVNQGAIHFYERLGFLRTGRTEPYPNNSAIAECEMSLNIM